MVQQSASWEAHVSKAQLIKAEAQFIKAEATPDDKEVALPSAWGLMCSCPGPNPGPKGTAHRDRRSRLEAPAPRPLSGFPSPGLWRWCEGTRVPFPGEAAELTDDFRSSTAAALEALVGEHERALNLRVAHLRMEILQLRGELSSAQHVSKLHSEPTDDVPHRTSASVVVAPRLHAHDVNKLHSEPTDDDVHISRSGAASDNPASIRGSLNSPKGSTKNSQGEHVVSFEEHVSVSDDASSAMPSDEEAPGSAKCGKQVTKRWSLTSYSVKERIPVPHAPCRTVSWNDTAHAVITRATFALSRRQSTVVHPEHLTFLQRFSRDHDMQHSALEFFMGMVILLNTITVAVSIESPMNRWSGWVYIYAGFACLFTMEFLLKLKWLGWRESLTGSRWNQFEVLLLVLAWLEVSLTIIEAAELMTQSSMVRVLMMLRLAKLLRILRLPVFCELLMMINGAVGSLKTLFYSMVLAGLLVVTVALVLKASLSDFDGHGAEMFRTTDAAIFSSFRCFVAGDCSQSDGRPLFVDITDEYGWFYGVLYCLVQFLMQFGLFNVITAIYVENTVSAAKYNDLSIKRRRLQDRDVFQEKAQKLLQLIWHRYQELSDVEIMSLKLEPKQGMNFNVDTVGRLRLSREFFEDLCSLQKFTDILRDLDISDEDQYDLFETLNAKGKGSITIKEFVTGIGKLRGEARKADLVYVALTVQSLQQKLEKLHRLMQEGGRTSGTTRRASEHQPTDVSLPRW